MTQTLSAVVIARDEEAMIGACLRRLHFADELLVVLDDRTRDATAALAAQEGARVVEVPFDTFAGIRNRALDEASGDWVLFVDADERCTAMLQQEIVAVLAGPDRHDAVRVRIQNWFWGSRLRWSGYREQPIRLLRRELARFSGDIHELASVASDRPIGRLRSRLVHLSHRSLADNLEKTRRYADIQAAELHRGGAPEMTVARLAAVPATTFIRHLFVGLGFLDGRAGLIESTYQAFSIFCVHVRLWELQRGMTPEERYALIEQQIP
ncbi:MAG: glycosyltransferase family 2 protein [Acidimicrobiales bacterium]